MPLFRPSAFSHENTFGARWTCVTLSACVPTARPMTTRRSSNKRGARDLRCCKVWSTDAGLRAEVSQHRAVFELSFTTCCSSEIVLPLGDQAVPPDVELRKYQSGDEIGLARIHNVAMSRDAEFNLESPNHSLATQNSRTSRLGSPPCT